MLVLRIDNGFVDYIACHKIYCFQLFSISPLLSQKWATLFIK